MNKHTRYIKIFILIVAFVLSAAHVVFDTKFWSDEHHQLSAAVTYNNGHGICLPYADKTHPDNTIYVPVTQFPIGYSYCLSFLILLTGSFLWSTILLQLLAVVFFYSGILLILDVFESFLKREAASIALVVIGISTATFGFYLTTDFLAITFYVFGLGLLLRCLAYDGTRLFVPILAAASLFLSLFYRYAYYPFVFILPLYILFWSVIKRSRTMALTGGVVLVCILSLVFVNNFIINSNNQSLPDYALGGIANAKSTVLYWAQLKSIDFTPFIKSLIDDRLLFSLFKFIIPPKAIAIFATLISLSILVSLIYFAKLAYDKYRHHCNEKRWMIVFFVILSLLLIIVNYTLLAGLSLITPAINSDIYSKWTFVGELRYYAPVYILVPLSVIILLYNTEVDIRGINSIRRGFLFVLIVSVTYSVYSRFVTIRSKANYFSLTEAKIYDELASDNRFDRIKALGLQLDKNGTKPIFISMDRSRWVAPLYGYRIGNMEILKSDFSKCKTEIVVLSEKLQPVDFKMDDFCFANRYKSEVIEGGDYFIYVLAPL